MQCHPGGRSGTGNSKSAGKILIIFAIFARLTPTDPDQQNPARSKYMRDWTAKAATGTSKKENKRGYIGAVKLNRSVRSTHKKLTDSREHLCISGRKRKGARSLTGNLALNNSRLREANLTLVQFPELPNTALHRTSPSSVKRLSIGQTKVLVVNRADGWKRGNRSTFGPTGQLYFGALYFGALYFWEP